MGPSLPELISSRALTMTDCLQSENCSTNCVRMFLKVTNCFSNLALPCAGAKTLRVGVLDRTGSTSCSHHRKCRLKTWGTCFDGSWLDIMQSSLNEWKQKMWHKIVPNWKFLRISQSTTECQSCSEKLLYPTVSDTQLASGLRDHKWMAMPVSWLGIVMGWFRNGKSSKKPPFHKWNFWWFQFLNLKPPPPNPVKETNETKKAWGKWAKRLERIATVTLTTILMYFAFLYFCFQ